MRLLPVLVGLLVLVGCRDRSERPERLKTVPEELAPRVARANAAMDELQKTLGGRLKQALDQGPEAAIQVCSKEAQQLTRQIGERNQLEIGRSSHRLRNPANEGPSWLAGYLADNAGRKAASVEPAVYDLGDRIGVARAIGMQPLCTICHGPAEAIDENVKRQLAQAYPHDRATGFQVGDLRGVFWVELPKQP